MASSHLNWLIVRDHNSFMIKQRNIPKPFSKVNINLSITPKSKHFFLRDVFVPSKISELLYEENFATSDFIPTLRVSKTSSL